MRMPEICDSTIYRPFEIVFKENLNTGLFPSKWKRENIAPTHKKGIKQVLKNYRLVSRSPICGKIFETLIFNEMFSFFLKITFFHQICLGSNLGILTLNSYYPLHIKSFSHFMKDMKIEAYSCIFSIYLYILRYGTKD